LITRLSISFGIINLKHLAEINNIKRIKSRKREPGAKNQEPKN